MRPAETAPLPERLPIRDLSDIRAIEAMPLDERVRARTLLDLFDRQASDRPDATALIWLPQGRADDRPETWTYAEMRARIVQLANLLRGAGVGPDAPVSLLLRNEPDMHFLLWAGAIAGVVSPINPHLPVEQIAEIVAATGSRVLVAPGMADDPELAIKARAVRDRMPATLLFSPGKADTDAISLDECTAEAADELMWPQMIGDDAVAALLHTGGTTGVPKLVRQTHRNQLVLATIVAETVGWRAEERVLTGLPLFHNFAAFVSGLAVFAAGGAVILAGREGFRSRETIADFWRIVERLGVTAFCAVPTILGSLLDLPREGADVSTLRTCICGASPLPPSLFRAFEAATGVRLLEGYGLTEATSMSTVNPRDGERRIGSIGLPLPYHKAVPAILDGDGRYVRDCAIGEVGMLLLHGGAVTPGYRDAIQNAALWARPGWISSGDLARCDADGYIWLAGRSKDLIIRSGHNIDPAVIEEALARHPAVELAAAVGRPDAYAGEVPVAFVTLRVGCATTGTELRDFTRDGKLERAAAPVEVVVLDTMPTTAVGKIFKPELRERVARDAVSRALAAAGLTADRIDATHDVTTGLTVSVTATAPAAVNAAVRGLGLAVEVVSPTNQGEYT